MKGQQDTKFKLKSQNILQQSSTPYLRIKNDQQNAGQIQVQTQIQTQSVPNLKAQPQPQDNQFQPILKAQPQPQDNQFLDKRLQIIKHHDGEEAWSIDADDEPYARQRSNTVKLSKESEVMKNLEKEKILLLSDGAKGKNKFEDSEKDLEEQEVQEKEEEEADEQAEQEKRKAKDLIINYYQQYKLADYFLTAGIDDYYQPSEVQKFGKETPDNELPQIAIPDFKLIDESDTIDRVVSKLEILVIKELRDGLKHPSELENKNDEKWIDLRGDKRLYLKVTFDKIHNMKKPLSDLNFYKIEKFKEQANKMQIYVRQGIAPVPVKIYGDSEADQKFQRTKKLDKHGNKNDDIYHYYGDYDLSPFFEEDRTGFNSKTNLCLCYSYQRGAPIQDITIVQGKRYQLHELKPEQRQKLEQMGQQMNLPFRWEPPEGYTKLAYSTGMNGVLDRLLCIKKLDILEKKLKARVLDRYPPQGQDRAYYPFPQSIPDFCFPSGLQLKTQAGQPEFFNFSLTDQDGNYIFGSCLVFDEKPSKAFRDKLKSMYVKGIPQVRTFKAICILSHFCFNNAFKEILKQLYRIQMSNSPLAIPIERMIVNIIEEIPLPDEGKLLVQHEIGGQTVSFYRPNDQFAPYAGKKDLENLFNVLTVDIVLEIFTFILLERKVLFISQHKALLTQVINCFASFLFPLQWKHTLIPILPANMIDVLEAPFPYLIGTLPNPGLEYLELENDVLKVFLDNCNTVLPQDVYVQSQIPNLPSKESRQLKQRLEKATYMCRVPNINVLNDVDNAFNTVFTDPDEEEIFDHLEVRDAFLEFMSSCFSGYTFDLQDLSDAQDQITQLKDCFDIDQFRLRKDAKKPFHFIYKLTETTQFAFYIESRALGRTEFDAQIIHFEQLLSQKRTLMHPRLTFPFVEEKSVKSMQPSEENLAENSTYGYKVFPIINPELLFKARKVPDYTKDTLYQRIMGPLIRNDQLVKMHDNEWARYLVEVIHLLWYQIFCSTLPLYAAYTPSLIDFSRRILAHLKSKLKPLRDVEYIYRRLFQACGTCKQGHELKQLYREMIKNQIQPDKVTSGTYYQALLECKRRGGTSEHQYDLKRAYFSQRLEDYQGKLTLNAKRENSRLSRSGINKSHSRFEKAESEAGPFKQGIDTYHLQQLTKNRQSVATAGPQPSGEERGRAKVNKIRLSELLDSPLFIDLQRKCPGCKEELKEEELLSGFQKNINEYVIKCPNVNCSRTFVPKFIIYCENENQYLPNGRHGKIINLLPPITLYKEFFNILMKEGDRILMNSKLIEQHAIVFWNIIFYFKLVRLPIFMLDLDYGMENQKHHCQQIKQFLPFEKGVRSIFGGGRSGSRHSNRGNKYNQANIFQQSQNSVNKLNSQALQQLDALHEKQNSASDVNYINEYGAAEPQSVIQNRDSIGSNTQVQNSRPNSIKRAAGTLYNIFTNSKKPASTSQQPGLLPPKDQSDAKKRLAPQGGVSNRNTTPWQIGSEASGIGSTTNFEEASLKLTQQQSVKLQVPLESTDRKNFQGFMGHGLSNLINNFKKPLSQKSGSTTDQRKSGGGSVVTSLSDLEKMERIMTSAQFANKQIVKYFGKYCEEFRREMIDAKNEVLLEHQIFSDGNLNINPFD